MWLGPRVSPLVISPAALDKWNIGVALASPDVEVQGRGFDLPERLSDLLFRILQQNGGKLSRRARENEFAALTDQEVERIEAAYREAFGKGEGRD